jgi:hypothetical protein
MSAIRHIVYLYNRKTRIKKRPEKMLEELVFGFWFALGIYVFWYMVKRALGSTCTFARAIWRRVFASDSELQSL